MKRTAFASAPCAKLSASRNHSVPSAPDLIEGVINLRGKIIPVMDLRKRFGQTEIISDKKTIAIDFGRIERRKIIDRAIDQCRLFPARIDRGCGLLVRNDLGLTETLAEIHHRDDLSAEIDHTFDEIRALERK